MDINTGINKNDRKTIADALAKLLADSYTLYLKTQNFHWNVTGAQFTNLHELFEKQYQDLANAVDAIAERIRALGLPAPGSYKEFSSLTSIKEASGSYTADKMIEALVADNESIVRNARELFPSVDEAKDESTADLLTERMEVHEKNAWMLRSLLD